MQSCETNDVLKKAAVTREPFSFSDKDEKPVY